MEISKSDAGSFHSFCVSSAAKVGLEGAFAPPPPIGLSTKMQNKKNTTFLALLKLVFGLEWTKTWFKLSFELYIQGG